MGRTAALFQQKKIYDYIITKKGEMEFELQNIINYHEKLYYPDYIKSVDGLTLLHNYPLFQVRNLETLKKYIEKSNPEISINSKRMDYYMKINRVLAEIALKKAVLSAQLVGVYDAFSILQPA